MKVKLFGGLRYKAGGVEHAGSGATIREALTALCRENEPLRRAIFDGDQLQRHVRVLLNGRDCELLQGLETAVTDQDQIAVFPPIAGG